MVLCNPYYQQRSCGQGYVFTHVCDSVHSGGGAIPACIACGIAACLAAGLQEGVLSQHTLQVVSQHALQQVSRGCLLGGVPGLVGVCYWGSAQLGGCGLLLFLWPSGVAFWFGGLLIEGSLLVESSLLLWPSGMAFW